MSSPIATATETSRASRQNWPCAAIANGRRVHANMITFSVPKIDTSAPMEMIVGPRVPRKLVTGIRKRSFRAGEVRQYADAYNLNQLLSPSRSQVRGSKNESHITGF